MTDGSRVARHERPGNDEDDEDVGGYAPSLGDTVTRWRYTLWPVSVVDEDSSTGELLNQQVLELRAVRHWLVLVWWTLLLTLGLIVAIAVAVTR